MIDVTTLRDTIETLLEDELGIYTFSTGSTTPAIRVDDGADAYTEEPQVTGLEVVIRPEVEIGLEPMLAGDRRINYRSEVVLKQWNPLLTTQQAREILMAKLEGLEEVKAIVPRSKRLDNIETCVLVVSDGFYTFG